MTTKAAAALPVTVDKSHIHTIGERLYTKSIELVRELVNNAYDADASRVDVMIDHDNERISVEDNGTGMDEAGLREYFTIGSKNKRENPTTEKYKRSKIGELGIGKFSSLGAASQFKVSTKKGDFAATVTFSKKDWEKAGEWSVPIEYSHERSTEHDGTTVVLDGVTQHFTVKEVIDRLRSSVPISEKSFEVYVNGTKVSKESVKGRVFVVDETTKFGPITGEIVVADTPLKLSDAGVECRVKNVTITKSLFGNEGLGHGINRVVGSVNADFLRFTSARDNFLIDTPEYKEFSQVMRNKMADVVKFLRQEESEVEIEKRTKALTEANKKVNQALKKRPDLTPTQDVLVSPKAKHAEYLPEVEALKNYSFKKEDKEKKKDPEKEAAAKDKVRSTMSADRDEHKDKVIKKIRNDYGIKMGFCKLGPDGVVSYFDDGEQTIYINREHQLYTYFANRAQDSEVDHLIKVIVAETVLLKKPADMRQYLDWQNELLLAAYS